VDFLRAAKMVGFSEKAFLTEAFTRPLKAAVLISHTVVRYCSELDSDYKDR
jgi:hypothetical protein